MADEISNNENIYVEATLPNIVLLDPNKVVENGKIINRAVKQEDLTIYVNLTANITPRSSIITGVNLETESNVELFDGQINFLKPKGKTEFTSDWADDFTDPETNKKVIEVNQTNNSIENVYIENKRDSEAFGINSISVTINKSYTPMVTIGFTDVRGKTLFEQGPNSPYAAFFHMPYPIFNLVIKGYFGKAVRFQLMMYKFNAKFEPESGNYEVTCNFVGKTSALLSDINMQEILSAPYMYSKMSSTTDTGKKTPQPKKGTSGSNPNQDSEPITTTKGAQTLQQVFDLYRAKKLISPDVPVMTVYELVQKSKKIEKEIQDALTQVDVDEMTDIGTYGNHLENYRTLVIGVSGWADIYLDKENTVLVAADGTNYYQLRKKYLTTEKKEEGIKRLKELISRYNKFLKENKSFGKGRNAIAVNIKYTDIVVSAAPEEINPIPGVQYFVLNNLKTSFEEKWKKIYNEFQEKKTKIQQELTNRLSLIIEDKVLKFRPTVRNIIGILIAGADTFLRLLADTHKDAMIVKGQQKRLNTVASMGTLSVDKIEETGENKDKFIYPWPLYYVVRDKVIGTNNNEVGQDMVLTYPGAADVISRTGAYDSYVWPEIDFVEQYLRAQVLRGTDVSLEFNNELNNPTWVPISPCDFFTTNPIYNIPTVNSSSYEIWDRSVFNVFNSGISGRFLNRTKSVVYTKAQSELDSHNFVLFAHTTPEASETYKNNTFSYESFRTFLQQLSPLEKWQLLIRDNYNTDYIRTLDQTRGQLFATPTVENRTFSEVVESQETIKKYLEVVKNPQENDISLDTYPLDDLTYTALQSNEKGWLTINLASSVNLDKQKLYSIKESLKFDEELKLYTNKYRYQHLQWIPLTNWQTHYTNIFEERMSTLENANFITWRNFYLKDVMGNPQNGNINTESTETGTLNTSENKKRFLTEGVRNMGESHSINNTLSSSSGTSIDQPNFIPTQITSMLNTSWFTEAFVKGVEKDWAKTQYPYKEAAYLLLQSLPIANLNEKGLKRDSIDSSDTVENEWGDYLFTSFNQVSALHKLPYATILKYGSEWHKWKTALTEGDAQDWVSNDFMYTHLNSGGQEYKKYYDPINGLLNTAYLLDIYQDGTPINFYAEATLGGNFDKINLGFYPRLIDFTHWFITDFFLFELNYASSNIDQYIAAGALNVKKLENLTISEDVGFDVTAPLRDLSCSQWYTYYDNSINPFSGASFDSYFLYPSSGGLKESQLRYDVPSPNLMNNIGTHNGNMRFFWAASNYGWFDPQLQQNPYSWESFNLPNQEGDQQSYWYTRASATTIVDSYTTNPWISGEVFGTEVLDKFEAVFLNFCQRTEDFDFDLVKRDDNTILDPSVSVDNEAWSSMFNFKELFKRFMVIDKNKVIFTPEMSNEEKGMAMSKVQLSKINMTLSNFLDMTMEFNFIKPDDINIPAIRSFLGESEVYNFGSYVEGSLPGDSLGTTIIDSINSHQDAWKTYVLEVCPYAGVTPSWPALSYFVSQNPSNTITEFFRVFNVEFTAQNIILLRKVIKIFITDRLKGFKNDTFKDRLTEIFDALYISHVDYLTNFFITTQKNLPDVAGEGSALAQPQQNLIKGDDIKLELYLLFKALNDRWISGYNFEDRVLFEDFMFLDRANRDIGDEAIMDISSLQLLDTIENANVSLYNYLGTILSRDNKFNVLALPGYINFYGGSSPINVESIAETFSTDEAGDIFGTHLQVDYLDSRPKYLCQYIGERSEYLEMESDKMNYKNDALSLGRAAGNSLMSNCNDPQKCNKVVSFAVDFGIQNQNIFKGVSLDQSEFRNTSETFTLLERLNKGASGRGLASQGQGLYNVYRSRSYTCQVTSMGNACIQPTMYFSLRHVPMFTGDYLITAVEHNISPNDMTTSFTGVRVPFYNIPSVQDLVSQVNKTFLTKAITNKKNKTKKPDNTTTADGLADLATDSIDKSVINGTEADKVFYQNKIKQEACLLAAFAKTLTENGMIRSGGGKQFQQFSGKARRMKGTGSKSWSLHGTGEAIDIWLMDTGQAEKVQRYIAENLTNVRLIIDYKNQRIWKPGSGWQESSTVSPSYSHWHVDRGGVKENGAGWSPPALKALGFINQTNDVVNLGNYKQVCTPAPITETYETSYNTSYSDYNYTAQVDSTYVHTPQIY
tara:strand:+ start:51055 stop:57495 length:6441 start_codon:yes stop_codon:yes gene_type:complete